MKPDTKNQATPTSPAVSTKTETVPNKPADISKSKSIEPLVEPGEQLISVAHRHPIGIVAIYIGAMAALAAILTLFLFAPSKESFNGMPDSTSGAVTGAVVFTIIILAVILLAIVRVYKQSKLIVTDKSLVQVIQRSLFNRKISRLSMSNVEDVNAEKKGIFLTIFNYGTLTIQTAGEEDNFIFSWCPDPDVHADSILKARQQYVQKYGEIEHSKT